MEGRLDAGNQGDGVTPQEPSDHEGRSSTPGPAAPAAQASIEQYVEAGAPVTTEKPFLLEVRSRRMKVLAGVAVAVILAVHIFMAITVGIGYTGAAITPVDQWAFVGIGIIFAVLAFLALKRPFVGANEDGVLVRNFLGTRFYPWAVVYGLSFPPGARLARLELPEFEYVPLWAFQSADGDSALHAVSRFRELEAAYMPQD